MSTHVSMVDVSAHALHIEEKLVNVIVLDSLGGARFLAHIRSFYRAAGVIFVYDLSREKSFEKLNKWIVDERAIIDVQKMLIGNKSDLLEHVSEVEREAMRNRAMFLADELKIPFFQVSAKTGQNVHLAFSSLVRDIVKSLNLSSEKVNLSSEKVIVIDRSNNSGCISCVR